MPALVQTLRATKTAEMIGNIMATLVMAGPRVSMFDGAAIAIEFRNTWVCDFNTKIHAIIEKLMKVFLVFERYLKRKHVYMIIMRMKVIPEQQIVLELPHCTACYRILVLQSY